MILFSTLNDEAVKQVPDFSTTSNLARFKKAASAFFPKKGFFATPLIVDINILVYFTMVLSGLGVVQFATKDLLRWGANSTYFVGRGEWWRLLTCVFIHGGLMHIVMNMVSLYIAGTILEKKIGPQKFFAGYIITGIIASTVSIWWHDYIVSVGASGAILGLDGIILALLITKVFSQTWQKSLLILLAFTAGYTIVLGAFTGGVDNAAHVGGFIAGIIFGFIITPWLKKNKEEREEALVMEETGA
jgi:membrane associated rhomboid family serine protease